MLPLKTTLIINATTSGPTGLLLLAFPKSIAQLFRIENTVPFMATGIFFVLFATYVFITAIKTPVNQKSVEIIITLDTLWVVTSVILVATAYSALSLIGVFAIIAVALWVAGMAFLQTQGLQSKRLA